ncbi:hypothetical protein [Chthoniobacter sp.]|uniref:hypothetical protein n=1 Tax=Chthoniobacter sp. TaxID=2510640 RepID=UPI0032B0225B
MAATPSNMPTARFALIACLMLFLPAARTTAQEVIREGKSLEVVLVPPKNPVEEPDFRPGSLPFTAADAVQYFSTVLEMSPEKSPNGGTFFEHQHDPLPEDRWRIEVLAEDKNVIVEFTVGGNYGFGLAREFFESPLFRRDEFETFYEMLSNAKNAPVEKMRRFTLKMTLREIEQSEILTLRFTPRDDEATAARLRP